MQKQHWIKKFFHDKNHKLPNKLRRDFSQSNEIILQKKMYSKY